MCLDILHFLFENTTRLASLNRDHGALLADAWPLDHWASRTRDCTTALDPDLAGYKHATPLAAVLAVANVDGDRELPVLRLARAA